MYIQPNIIEADKPDLLSIETLSDNYADLLAEYCLPYKTTGHYLQVGEIREVQGWLLHLSVVAIQFVPLFRRIVPLLINQDIPFKIPVNKEIALAILDGQLGYDKVGKVITLYPETPEKALHLATILIHETRHFTGPRILTDFYLGAVLYTRYGGFNPVMLNTPTGEPGPYIYNPEGQLVQDVCLIPPLITPNMAWPFEIISGPKSEKPVQIWKDKYKPISILKQDAKGDVIKSLRLQKWFNVSSCVIKQGRSQMASDDYCRDIRDRLVWQASVHQQLQTFLPVPKIYDLFQHNDDTYLVMEFIKGTNLDDLIVETFQNTTWASLSVPVRLKLIDYAEQIIQIVQAMHAAGYVHRDITPMNFMVQRGGKLVLIDLELSYFISAKPTRPPFKLGTAWFMSPQQIAAKTPTFDEDSYGLGGTLITLLTGLLPSKFDNSDQRKLQKRLSFYLADNSFCGILASCLNEEPTHRPILAILANELRKFKQQQRAADPGSPRAFMGAESYPPEEIESLINSAIRGLTGQSMVNSQQLWLSKKTQHSPSGFCQFEEPAVYGGMFSGISGVLYVLLRAAKCGYQTDFWGKSYEQNINYLEANVFQKMSSLDSGLFTGSAGMALTLSEWLSSGIMNDPARLRSYLNVCFEVQNEVGPDIGSGVAGIGISMISCIPNLSSASDFLRSMAIFLVTNQQADGSWVSQESNNKRNLKICGFSNGVAGILYFLLCYNTVLEDKIIETATRKGLNWLMRQSFSSHGRHKWPISNQSKFDHPGLHAGFTGVALTFIKAYEVFRDPIYKEMAEGALFNHPDPTVSRDLTLATGLTGIGEVYLEAWRVFNNEKWLSKAKMIQSVLLNSYRVQNDGAIYWIMDGSAVSTPGLMTGNSGAIHFLMRCERPGKLSFPLLPT